MWLMNEKEVDLRVFSPVLWSDQNQKSIPNVIPKALLNVIYCFRMALNPKSWH